MDKIVIDQSSVSTIRYRLGDYRLENALFGAYRLGTILSFSDSRELHPQGAAATYIIIWWNQTARTLFCLKFFTKGNNNQQK